MNILFSFNSRKLRIILRGCVATVMLLSGLFGCSSSGKFFDTSHLGDDKMMDRPAKDLAHEGMEAFNMGNYTTALESFNKLLDTHRFSPEAVLAELKIADSNYYLSNYAEALTAYQQFEDMHPTNEAIPYVMYQKAMCYYSRIDRIDRDINNATKSIELFNQLIKAYPESPYVDDAKGKIVLAKEFLANHEYAVAKFYLRTDRDKQATLRLKYLISMYPETKIYKQAQKLLAELEGKD